MRFAIAEIVDVAKDKHMAGRAKIRLVDDQRDLKDDQLRYARPMFPVTAAMKDGAGATPGYTKGSQVIVAYLDNDSQVPYIIGTIGSSGKQDSNAKLSQKGRSTPTGIDKKPPDGNNVEVKDVRYKADDPGNRKLDSNSIIKVAKELANGKAKFPDIKTVGSMLPTGSNATDFIKKIDPKNVAGPLGAKALDLAKNFMNSGPQKILNMVGGSQILTAVLAAATAIQQQQSNQVSKRDQLITLLNLITKALKEIEAMNITNYSALISNSEQLSNLINQFKISEFFIEEINNIFTLVNEIGSIEAQNSIKLINNIITNILNLQKLIITEINKIDNGETT